jgi:hypothetical protein
MADKKKQAGKATKEYKKVRSNAPRVSYTEPSGMYTGPTMQRGITFAQGGPTDPIVTRATTLPDGSIIPMMDLPEINITAESPQTSLSNLMSNPYMQQRQTALQQQGVFNSQNKGTVSNTQDRPWYSGIANIYEQGKRNQAVQALGAGALGTAAIAGGYAAAPYVASALPAINAGMTAPIAGIPGATAANLLKAYGIVGFGTHTIKAGQKAYAGAPASEVTREMLEGGMDVITPGYKTFGPVAKAVWKGGLEQPVTDIFYNTGQNYVDSLSTPTKNKMGGMTYGLGAHVVQGGPRWIDTYGTGTMIRRADGSYSPRGLWDNIRANRGSGKEPTKEMLKQEHKIRNAEKNEFGGTTGMYDVYGDGDKVNLNLPVREMPVPQRGLDFNNYLNISPDMVLRGGINPMYYGNNFSVGPYATGYAGLQGAGINDYGVRGTYNINNNLSIGADMNPKRINAGVQYKFAKGGSITPIPTGDIFDMMGMSYLNQFALGAEIPCDNPPCPPAGSMDNPRLVTAVPEGYTQDSNNPRLYVKKSNMASGTGTGTVSTRGTKTTGTTVKPKPVTPRTGTTGMGTTQRSIGTTGKTVTPRSSSTGTFKSQEDYVYMQEPLIPVQMRPTQLITQNDIGIQPVAIPDKTLIPPGESESSGESGGKSNSRFKTWWRSNVRRPVRKLCNKVKDSTGRFVDQCFEFEDGGTVPFDVKAPMYDETEFPQFINPDVYAYGSGIHIKPENRGKFTAWASSRGMSVPEAANKVMANTDQYSPGVVKMANFAKNAAGWNKNEMGGYYGMGGYYKMGGYPSYAMGGNLPMYAFGDVVKKIGAGAYGVGEGLLDTVTMGATDQLTDMGYEGLQNLGGSEGKDNRTEDMIRGFGTTAGAVTGAIINPAATGTAVSQGAKGLGQGISFAAPESQAAQAIGQFLPVAGNIAGMFTGSPAAGSTGAAKSAEFASSGFGKMAGDAAQAGKMFNQISPLLGMFSGQNAMGGTMKNGGMTPRYMQDMPTFAQGGMTMGNVEARELLIDPGKPAGGGVPKILTNYSSPNLPSHPKDGSIDDRGTVPLPEGKFIITQAENNRYKTAARSNDKLMADAITNNIQIKRDRKEAQEMQKASTAYNRFMSKYGGAIEKMYACGGKTYGCGGSVKRYDDGASTPTMGWTLPSWMAEQINTPVTTTPEGFMGIPYASDYNPYAAEGRYDMLDPNYTGNYKQIGLPLKRADNYGTITSITPKYLTRVDNSTVDNQTVVANTSTIEDVKKSGKEDVKKSGKKDINDKNKKIGANQILGALQMAAPLYNVGRGLFSKVAEVPTGLGMVSTDIEAPRMTDAAGRRAIREQMNLAKYNAGQLGGANVLPTYAALGTAGAKAASDYTERLRNTLAEATYSAAMDRKRLEAANAQQAAQNWQTQEYLKGIKDQLLSTGVGQVGEAAGQLRKENIYGNAMKDFYTNYTYDPATNTWSPRKA